MFEDFFAECKPKDKIRPSKKRFNKNIAAVRSLIKSERGSTMAKRKLRFKPLIITAAVIITSVVSLLTVNAATNGALVKFFMGGEEIEGGYRDYVDHDGYRHVSFEATLPIYEENYAIIFDVDAPAEEAVRVITDETDPEFMDKLRQYKDAIDNYRHALGVWKNDPEHNDYPGDVPPGCETVGLVFKDSELCSYSLGYVTKDSGFYLRDGYLGGKFMSMGAAEGHPSGCGSPDYDPRDGHYDWESETKTMLVSFFYYVGKE